MVKKKAGSQDPVFCYGMGEMWQAVPMRIKRTCRRLSYPDARLLQVDLFEAADGCPAGKACPDSKDRRRRGQDSKLDPQPAPGRIV